MTKSSDVNESSFSTGLEKWNRGDSLRLRKPVWVYDNWGDYTHNLLNLDRLDNTLLTEEFAMRKLLELERLRRSGVHFDGYMMNAFWFDSNGGYRSWDSKNWPQGPDRWIDGCLSMGISPGLWFGTNSLWKLNPANAWRDSFVPQRQGHWVDSLSLIKGGFLEDFMQVLEYWYGRGIRLFELDFADFDAATEADNALSVVEIRDRSKNALINALKAFRLGKPDILMCAFNGYGGDFATTSDPLPFKDPIEMSWLQVFDTLYCGDIRVSDVPSVNFWRSVDLYGDHMTRRYEQVGVPTEQIDAFFVLSRSWFGYNRGKQAWKGMLLETAARGSWKKTIYGAIDLLNDEDASWFGKVQTMYQPLLSHGHSKSFGAIPGDGKPYGFCTYVADGSLCLVINPAQAVQSIELPNVVNDENLILFRDDGFVPTLSGTSIELGPEQLVLIGSGYLASAEYDLGIQRDVIIPRKIVPMATEFHSIGSHVITAQVSAPVKGDLRAIFKQRGACGEVLRSPFVDIKTLDSPEDYGKLHAAPMQELIKIEAHQDGRAIEVVREQDDKVTPFGISWAAGEIRGISMDPGSPITLRCSSAEKNSVRLSGELYVIEY